jgi:23S rRNA G2069 N7-methylase RlmK/C1962 C5-methylase RlmI
MLSNRLKKRQRHLRRWAARTGAGVYRLYDRDIPEIPLVLDFYHNDECCALSGALYQRPYEKDADEEELWLSAMKSAIASSLCIDTARIFLKIRKRQRTAENPGAQYAKEQIKQTGQTRAFTMIVKENGLSFSVNLSDYIDTGIFPDLRKLRKMVMAEAAGRTVLNLFCYTGSFSVYAAKGGARQVDSVDMSSTYLRWAARNCGLNGIELPFARADVFRFLEQAASRGRRWDMIIADPPAFSNSKKMRGNSLNGAFDMKHDYPFLIGSCLPLLKKSGRLFFCANAHSFNLKTSGLFPREITEQVRDEDFKGKRMPKCYILTNP